MIAGLKRQSLPTLLPLGDITTTTWDYESRQQSVETPTGTLVTLTYNCDDWRVQRDDGFDVTRYQYDKNNLLAELDGSLVVVQYTNEPNEYGRVISQYRPGGQVPSINPRPGAGNPF